MASCIHTWALRRLLPRLTWNSTMMQARAYADPGQARRTKTGLWNGFRRLWMKGSPDDASAAPKNVVVVPADEFERIRQCLIDSQENPSVAALRGAEML